MEQNAKTVVISTPFKYVHQVGGTNVLRPLEQDGERQL